MTLHLRQPLPAAEIEHLIDEALFAGPQSTMYRDHAKRIVDIALVLMAAIPVLLVLAVAACLVALDGKSPVYFQKRVGLGGRIFNMVKLRSMVPNADKLLEKHLSENAEARAEWSHTQKLRNDPRITRVGRFIRKTSLDELPQLWNVLKGDMSLVGPRPMMVDQQDLYPGTAYYALRPGITGFWQVSARNESSFAERAGFDAAYLRQLSLGTDISVIAKTVNVVLRGTGC